VHYMADVTQWWQALGAACIYAIIGDDEGTQYRIRRAQDGRHLAWEPFLKDAACFERLASDPEYTKLVKHFDDLRADLRSKLPDTLEQFGVAL